MVGHVYIDETLSAYGIENLDNIEVYYDKLERIHIAGVGQHVVSGIPVGFKAFEAVGYVPTSMQYKVADLYGGEPIPIPRVTVTDDFVLYATPAYNICGFGIGHTLEPFPKDDMFALTTHPVYLFQTVAVVGIPFPTGSDPEGISFEITYKSDNTIAICNYRCGVTSCSYPPFCSYTIDNNYQFVLREYDLSPLLSGNPIQMTSSSHVKLPLGVGGIRKLAYDLQTKHYVTLFSNEVSAGTGTLEDAVMTLDYSLGTIPATARATYPHNSLNGRLWDMCLDGSSKYTVCGWLWANYNYLFWHDNVLSNAFACANYINYDVYPGDIKVDKELEFPSNVVGWIALNFLPNMEVELLYQNNILDCN